MTHLLHVTRGIGQRFKNTDESNSIGNRVMYPQDKRGVASLGLDDMAIPARSHRIEWLAAQARDKGLQANNVGRRGQDALAHMPVEIKVGIVFPPGAVSLEKRQLPETWVTQQTFLKESFKALDIKLPDETHNPDDLHQIAGTIHAQPCRVDSRHTLAPPLTSAHPPSLRARPTRRSYQVQFAGHHTFF